MDILIENVEGSLWAAAVKDKRLYGIEIDPAMEGIRWGAIHWASVERFDTRMDVAFLDLGHGEQGIINGKDIRPRGTKDEAIQKKLRPGQMILVQAKTTTLPLDLHSDWTPEEHKLAKMSMDIAIPGRYMIYLPLAMEKKISSRIKDKAVRSRMLKMLDKVEEIDGCILRSAAANVQTDVLVRESRILKNIWIQLQDFKRGEVPSLIMEGPDAMQRLGSDLANEQVEEIITDDSELVEDIENWCDLYAPDLMAKIRIVENESGQANSLIDAYDMISEVESLIQPYVILPSGGNIIIQQTNALTAIDVNLGTGKSKTEVNIEAARETVRQLRLRNIGGAIVIDFINMREKKIKDDIIKILKEETLQDPCTVDVHNFTNLGFVELTRARRTPPLEVHLQINMAAAGESEF